jgi:hypothetical protein
MGTNPIIIAIIAMTTEVIIKIYIGGGSISWSRYWEEKKNLCPCREQNPYCPV